MEHIGPTIKPALWCDHGRWQVTRDETCLYLAPRGRLGYWLCRLWCWRHGYGWLPVI
jgi:hypothetical protein